MYSKMIKLLVIVCISTLPQIKLFAADYEYNTIAGLKSASIPADDSTNNIGGFLNYMYTVISKVQHNHKKNLTTKLWHSDGG